MSAWALEHPWMAFVIAIMLVMTIESLQANICRVIAKRRKGDSK